jgi:hypothetical protein
VVIHRITAESPAELACPPHGPVVNGFALRCISKPISPPSGLNAVMLLREAVRAVRPCASLRVPPWRKHAT